jgi:hypothetical protein
MFILDGIMKLCCCVNFFGRCKISQQVCTYPGVNCYNVSDYALIYDSRANMALIGTVDVGTLDASGGTIGGPPVMIHGIAFSRVMWNDLGGVSSCGPTDPPCNCPTRCGTATPAPILKGIFFACDYA